MNREHPIGFWWCSSAQTKKRRKFSGRTRSRKDFCGENLINALKLLANQQRDGDSPIQSIVTGLREKSRERITNGLRRFIARDIHCAVEVGHLRKSQRPFRVKKPKVGEDQSEVLREGAGDLTLRADTLKACINVDHIGETCWDRLWWTWSGTLFAKQLKGIEGSEWEDLYDPYRDMRKAAGSKKSNESQRAKALWAMKAAKDREEDFYDPARKDNILGRNQTRQELWRAHLKDPIEALDNALKYLENQY